jgi:hypothetical protein
MSGVTVKLADGVLRDQLRQDVYDTITLAAGESPMAPADRNFFASVQGKAKYLTNLRINSQFEGNVSYRIQGIQLDAFVASALNAACLPLLVNHGYIEVRIGEKIYLQSPMKDVCGKMEVFGSNMAAPLYFAQLGRASEVGVVLKGTDSLDIAPSQTFNVLWQTAGMTAAEAILATPAAATKIDFKLSFKGLMRRPVQ